MGQMAIVTAAGNVNKPIFLKIRSAKSFIIFVVTFAVSTDIFMYGLLVPVTPTALEAKLNISENKIQSWTSILLALYSAAFLVFSPLFGYLADHVRSRKWPLLLGLVVLGMATALLCIGTHITLWVVGRLLQGAAVAMVWTVGLALLVDTVGEDELGQAIGYVSMGLNIGVLSGPLVGGVVSEHAGYYAVWTVAFGLIGIDFVLRLAMIEKKDAAQWLVPDGVASQPLERRGDGTTGCSISSTIARSTEVPLTQSNLASNQQSFKQFIMLLSSPRLLISLWGTFLVSLVLTSFDSVLPLYVEETFGWQQTAQGLIFIALVVPHLVDPLVGSLVDRLPNAARFLISGAFVSAITPAILLRLVDTYSMNDKVILCALLAVIGLCLAIANTPLMLETFFAVKEKESALPGRLDTTRGGAVAFAFGLSNMAFAAGSVVGPFFAGYIRQRAGWDTFAWAMGLIVGVSSVPAVLWTGGWIMERRNQVVPEAHP
ncbi:major facilitator superfamily domain-containing protein [Aspergillus heterothallicus]